MSPGPGEAAIAIPQSKSPEDNGLYSEPVRQESSFSTNKQSRVNFRRCVAREGTVNSDIQS